MADDEQDIRHVARLALELEGWRVMEAENGLESWRLVRENLPALVIIDLMMPQMSGVEVCHKIAEDANLRNVPVLLISGVNERAKILDDFWDLPLRYKNFLHKPFSTDELLGAIHGILPPTGMKFSSTAPASPKPVRFLRLFQTGRERRPPRPRRPLRPRGSRRPSRPAPRLKPSPSLLLRDCGPPAPPQPRPSTRAATGF